MERDDDAVNEVRLRGRVSARPEERVLPSGDVWWTLRVVVRRPPEAVVGRTTVDTVDCVVRGGRVRRSVATWGAGDTVEVLGRLRRRFYRAGGAVSSRTEVDVVSGRVVRRATEGR